VGVSERRERKEPRGDKLEFDGIVEEALPNAMFRVKADNGLNVLATISGRMRQFYIKILPGLDHGSVFMSPELRGIPQEMIDHLSKGGLIAAPKP